MKFFPLIEMLQPHDLASSWLHSALGFLVTYLLGSIPFGLLIAKAFRLPDLRAIGSGSTGATNVVRAGGKLPGALTLLLDAAKTVLGLWIAFGLSFIAADTYPSFDGYPMLLPFFGPMLGHCYSPWLRFNGGKGVAVLIGSYISLDLLMILDGRYRWPAFTLLYLLSWVLLFKTTRISSVGGMGAAIVTLAGLGIYDRAGHADVTGWLFFMLLTLFVLWRHRANIGRLMRGEEHRFPVKTA